MTIYMFGFNGFHQISSSFVDRHDVHVLSGLENASDFALSWSQLYYITGLELCIRGFASGKPFSDEHFVKIRCADRYVVAVTENGLGKIYTVGSDMLKYLHTVNVGGPKMVDCAVGDMFAVFINVDGKAILVELRSLTESLLPIANKIISAACGKEHVLVLNELKTIYSFGCGSRGQLGHGNLESEESPRVVECLEGISVQNIAAGGWHSAAITDAGDVYTWGWNESGQLGCCTSTKRQRGNNAGPEDEVIIQATPTCVIFPEEICARSVACGSRHTLVITDNGKLWGFGSNVYNQIGIDCLTLYDKPNLVKYFESNHLKVANIVCGGWTSLVTAT